METLIFPMAFRNARNDNGARSIFSPSHLLTNVWHSSVFIGIGRSVWIIESECVCTCYRDNAERRGKMRAKLKILYKMKIIYAWKYLESSLQTEITSIYLFIYFFFYLQSGGFFSPRLFFHSSWYDSLVKERKKGESFLKERKKKILEEKFELQIFLVREILHHFYEKPEGSNQ